MCNIYRICLETILCEHRGYTYPLVSIITFGEHYYYMFHMLPVCYAEHIDDPKPASWSGVKTFLLMLLGAFVLIVLAICGIMFYQKRQENRRKRFY